MSKLYFRYGTMGSSKTAQALITRFNYMERGIGVWLIKPSIDTRDGNNKLSSRIGINAPVFMVTPSMDIKKEFSNISDCQIIIADEAQFFTEEQVEQLRYIADNGTSVFCYGLRTDFQSKLFPGSKRLFELADNISEIKTVCSCGRKSIINARLSNGKVTTSGKQVQIGGNESYVGMCHKCWIECQNPNK